MVSHSVSRTSWTRIFGAPLVLSTAGLVQALSLAWPFDGPMLGQSLGWLQCLALAALAWHLDRSPTRKEAFQKTWFFSCAWLLGCTWWLFISMHRYGGLPAPLAAIAVMLLAAGLAGIYAVAGLAYRRLCPQNASVQSKVAAFAAVWTLAEIVRGTLWTGFPWGAVGYAHVDGLLRHWAPWFGVYGLCAIAASVAMWLGAQRTQHRATTRTQHIGTVCLLLVMGYAWVVSPSQSPEKTVHSPHPLRVTLLQGNIAQDLKFGAAIDRALHSYSEALLSSQADLTVAPETAIPITLQQMPEHYWDTLQTHFSKSAQAALIGLPLATRSAQGQLLYSNAAIGLMPQTTPSSTAHYQYDKHHLVPFGEFVPPLFGWFVRWMNIPLGDFVRGELAQPHLLFKDERIAPNICYEDLFGEELARRFVDPDQAPTLMVNLSNIAWFGNTVAIDQHLNISRMRALELGRPMLRATNTGATAVINAQGQVTHRLPSAVQGALTADVYGVHGPVTPYARWVSGWGLWPLVGLAMLTLFIMALVSYAAQHGQRRFGP